MAYTLWRNNESLGELVWESPTQHPPIISGLFQPISQTVELSACTQLTTWLPGHGRHTTQNFASRDRPELAYDRVVLNAAGEPLKSTPESLRLEVRAGTGAVIGTRLISLHHVPVGPPGNDFSDLCRTLGFQDECWQMAFLPYDETEDLAFKKAMGDLAKQDADS